MKAGRDGSGRRLELSAQARALLEKRLARAGLGSNDGPSAARIPRRDGSGPAPLSYAQGRLWFMHQIAPKHAFYNVPVVFRMQGDVDPRALRRALADLVRRHEVLRTSFPSHAGVPVQSVAADASVPLPIVDLTRRPVAEGRAEAERLANLEARKPFDLEAGPVLRALLVHVAPGEHWLVLTLHHIVADGWSMGILSRELAAFYEAALAGRPADLPELPIQYVDFAQWQRERLQGESLEAHLAYWRERLRDLPQLQLPSDRPREASPTFEGATRPFEIPDAVTAGLRRLARETGATLYMVLLAGFQAVLARYSGQDDIVVGSPIANRTHRDVEGLIGFFVNTLVMRGDLSGDPGFRELVLRTRGAALEAFAHQDVPFERLVEELQPTREPGRNPFFQVGFVLQTAWDVERTGRETGLGDDRSLPDIQRGSSIFDLAVHVWERRDGLAGVIEYSTALFDEATVARFGDHFTLLLEGAARAPDVAISDLPLVRDAERSLLLDAWNDTDAAFEDDVPFHRLVEAQARRRPDAAALRVIGSDDGYREVDYRTLDERANGVAHVLVQLGVGPGERVLLCLERSVELIVAILAVLKAGGAYVPLDPDDPPQRLHFMIEDATAPFMITTSRLWEALRPGLPADVAPRPVLLDALAAVPEATPVTAPEVDVGPDDLAYVIYTSGSTGRPKGVMIEHRGLCNVAAAQQRTFGVGPGSRVLQFASASFDASVFELAMALASGGTLCLAPPDLLLPGPALVELLRRHEVTMITLPPSALAALPRASLPALETITVAGEALPAGLVEAWRHGRRLFNLYGPTEATIWSTWADCTASRGKPPIGRPVPNTKAYILDPKGRPVPVGVPGELHLGGVGLAKGYLNRPDLTAERFVELPLDDGRPIRLFRTGDVARYRPNGDIDFIGRRDHQVKVRGFRIELEEIETVLRDLPGLQEAVVTAHEHGPGDKRLVAYVTPSDDFAASDPEAAVELASEQISYWRQVYDQTYGHERDGVDPTFDISGWNSSYDGRPLADDVMRAWVDHAVDRILAFAQGRVLEIGCGSGLLLFRIAAACASYTATDFSSGALAHVARHRERLGDAWARVRLLQREANDFRDLEPGRYDLVAINSVAQYFPTIDYLREVVAGAIERIGPTGTIFLGDVRSLPLLDTFALSVELAGAADATTVAELRERIARRASVEQELVVDPEFFHALRHESPRIGGVEILLKRGRHRDELTKFRYDVVLHVGAAPPPVEPSTRVDWAEASLTLDGLRTRLNEGTTDVLHLTGIPDRRLESELRVRAAVASSAATHDVTQVRAAAAGPEAGVEPEDVVALAEALGYRARLHVSRSDGIGTFDAVLSRTADEARHPVPSVRPRPARPWSHYANTPVRGLFLRKMVPRIRAFLADRLPDHMVPSQYVVLDRLPRNASGKVDRHKLPAPGHARPDLGVGYVPPAIDAEKTLAALWAEVLGLERVGVHDNFFELGGDSILGIQIVARARDAGLEIRPKDLFEHQTIAELATVCAAGSVAADQGPVVGDVPLTPIQHWFFERPLHDPHHFNQAVMLELVEPLDPELLREALRDLGHHHDALRLRFLPGPDGWRQVSGPPDAGPPLDDLDLTGTAPDDRASALDGAVAATHASLDLATGPALRALLVRFGPGGTGRLLLVAHHLVVDAVSWRTLLQDLATAYRQRVAREAVALPAKTTSFRRWAELLVERGASADLRPEVAFWQAMHAAGPLPLPVDLADGDDTVGAVGTVAARLESDDTAVLLTRLPKLFSTRVDEVLLAALARAVERWTGRGAILVDLERHGREAIFDGVDLSRTVGWFTTIAPVRLEVPQGGPHELLTSIKEQLRAVPPERGVSYGVARYLARDARLRESLASLPAPEIAFNYLGRYARPAFGVDAAGEEPLAVGSTRSGRDARRHKLELNGYVLDGRLAVDFAFGTRIHRRETVERLADDFTSALRELADLGRTVKERQVTASDFARARLSPGEFGKLADRLARKGAKGG